MFKDKKREDAKKLAAEKLVSKKKERSINDISTIAGGKEEAGGIDDLISSIRTGKAFQGQAKIGEVEKEATESIKKLRQGRNRASLLVAKPEEQAKKPLSFQNSDQGAVGRLKRQPGNHEKTLSERLG